MFLLFDVGGTKTRIAVSRDGKNFGAPKIIRTPKKAGEGIKTLKKAAVELAGGRKITAVVGGLAGSFDRRKEKIVAGGWNIEEWMRVSLKRMLEKAFHVPVFLENDAALAGLAEAVKGAGRGKEIVVYYTVSTGFGGARIVNGKIDANARGFEPSGQIINMSALERNYGKGRIGEYISGRGIETRFRKKPEKIKDHRIRNTLAKELAVAINNGILHWSPDVIVVGGSVTNIIPLQRVRFYLKKIYKGPASPPAVRRAKLGDLGGLWGALALLRSARTKQIR